MQRVASVLISVTLALEPVAVKVKLGAYADAARRLGAHLRDIGS